MSAHWLFCVLCATAFVHAASGPVAAAAVDVTCGVVRDTWPAEDQALNLSCAFDEWTLVAADSQQTAAWREKLALCTALSV